MRKGKKKVGRENGKSSGNDCVWYTDYSVGYRRCSTYAGTQRELFLWRHPTSTLRICNTIKIIIVEPGFNARTTL